MIMDYSAYMKRGKNPDYYVISSYNELKTIKNDRCSFGYSKIEDKSYLLKANKLLNDEGIILLYFNGNENRYVKSENEEQIKMSLFETLEWIRTERNKIFHKSLCL